MLLYGKIDECKRSKDGVPAEYRHDRMYMYVCIKNRQLSGTEETKL